MPKVVALISGGIDSPVAACLASRKMQIIPLHFCLYPFYCEDSFRLFIESLRVLREKAPFGKIVIYPWWEILSAILRGKERKYMCVLCRRGMLKAAELVCESEDALGMVTGESLGQKASQTLRNLSAVSHGVKYPILRPLIGLDKTEIQATSRKLGIWCEKHSGCCSATPNEPATAADVDRLNDLYLRFKIQALIEEAFTRRFDEQIMSPSDLDQVLVTVLKKMWSQTEDLVLKIEEFSPTLRSVTDA
ncbi:MAG: hypothetical protein V1857_01080 [archaeon]